MAASLRLLGAASGLRYWSRRLRPAAGSFAAGSIFPSRCC
ncbi:HIBADH isoform 2 [Pan troglodytes]|uniref:3-hydroxyisobutyrate dehydrogenase n=3 Tax=Hominidae TaxID=9604 RepID=F8WET2_HUMAN|nr:HIBADH isoform 2 [Pan troglodytes]PNJ55666.1 HIBADH isoform 2 [Pongo abelii]